MTFQAACMTAAEHDLWDAANRSVSKPITRPCIECPAWFAAEQRAQDTCNGEPRQMGRPTGGKHSETRREQWRAAAKRYRERSGVAA